MGFTSINEIYGGYKSQAVTFILKKNQLSWLGEQTIGGYRWEEGVGRKEDGRTNASDEKIDGRQNDWRILKLEEEMYKGEREGRGGTGLDVRVLVGRWETERSHKNIQNGQIEGKSRLDYVSIPWTKMAMFLIQYFKLVMAQLINRLACVRRLTLQGDLEKQVDLQLPGQALESSTVHPLT